jgi:hypothetical protein
LLLLWGENVIKETADKHEWRLEAKVVLQRVFCAFFKTELD